MTGQQPATVLPRSRLDIGARLDMISRLMPMNRYLCLPLITLLVVIVIKCERDRTPIIPVAQAKSIQLFLFASNDCHPCKHELPEVNNWYGKLSPNDKKRITPVVYYIAGPANKPANQNDADSFSKSLGLTFEIRADRYAKFYRTYYSSSQGVPAIVVASETGEALRIYRPGIVPVSELNKDVLDIISRRFHPTDHFYQDALPLGGAYR